MTMLARAEEIVSKLEAAGIRATIEPTMAMGILPCVLVNIPAERTNDVMCGATVRWALDCLVPVPNGWDRTAWQLMEQLIAAVEATFDIQSSRSQPFQRPGAAGLQTYPSYEMTFREVVE